MTKEALDSLINIIHGVVSDATLKEHQVTAQATITFNPDGTVDVHGIQVSIKKEEKEDG